MKNEEEHLFQNLKRLDSTSTVLAFMMVIILLEIYSFIFCFKRMI